jgi:hypothetical protein
MQQNKKGETMKIKNRSRKKVGEQLRQELETLQGSNPVLRPSRVVNWAEKHPESALHSQLEWDDRKAGREYRLWQARELIKTVAVFPTEKKPVWVSLTLDRSRGGGYRRSEDVKTIPNLRKLFVRDVLNEFIRLRDRYADLGELAPVYRAIDRMAKRVGKKRAGLAAAAVSRARAMAA